MERKEIEIAQQFEGETWVTQGEIGIEVFDGGANKYVNEVLAVCYQGDKIKESFAYDHNTLEDLEQAIKALAEVTEEQYNN